MEDSYQSAIKIWEQINLVELQKTLDEQGLKIINNQKESLASRKQLAEQTRDFKRLSNDEKLIKFKTLLKAYQNEIDNITKRSKVSETAFLNVYKLLLEAPDPSALLSSFMVILKFLILIFKLIKFICSLVFINYIFIIHLFYINYIFLKYTVFILFCFFYLHLI